MTTADVRPPDQGWRPSDTLAARLILMRRELKLSQRQAAERAGIPFGQWQGLEDEERQPRGINLKVQRIARAFQVDRDWLMWGGPLGSPIDTTPPSGPSITAGNSPRNRPRIMPRLARPVRHAALAMAA